MRNVLKWTYKHMNQVKIDIKIFKAFYKAVDPNK